MKVLKPILLVVLFLGAIGAAFFYGLNKVRNGLSANYPTIKSLVRGARIEVDSALVMSFTKEEQPALAAALNSISNADSFTISVPYYGRYEIDMYAHFYRILPEGNSVEMYLPAPHLSYCELHLENLVVNAKGYSGENFQAVRKALYEVALPKLSKHRANLKAAGLSASKALVFYFVPYKLDLTLYIENQLQELPLVPGVNKDVDEYIKEQFAH